MISNTAASPSKKAVLAGRILSGIAILFMLFDAVGKLVKVRPVIESTTQLGYPEGSIRLLGVLGLVSTVAYLIPRTALLGAVLLTGFLGGAIATHVRVGNPLLSHALFPAYLAVMIWGGLLLRDGRLRQLFPLRG